MKILSTPNHRQDSNIMGSMSFKFLGPIIELDMGPMDARGGFQGIPPTRPDLLTGVLYWELGLSIQAPNTNYQLEAFYFLCNVCLNENFPGENYVPTIFGEKLQRSLHTSMIFACERERDREVERKRGRERERQSDRARKTQGERDRKVERKRERE